MPFKIGINMKIQNITISIIITFFLFCSFSFSQSIVISEYRNLAANPDGEWTELLVIQDNLSLVGFILRDNAGSTPPPNSWQGGIRFRDVPLWKNLRAGTIIVINHRRNLRIDDMKEDGYIEVGAEDNVLFDTLCYNCTDWYQSGLNIAQESEIMQVIDGSGNHVHCLAHIPRGSLGGDFVNIPGNKICRNGDVRAGGSVKVVPGHSLAAYNFGFDEFNDSTAESNTFTKGKPNQSNSSLNDNQRFWRKMREPQWSSPAIISSQLNKDDVFIEWNSAIDPNPTDGLTGYMLIRVPQSQLAGAIAPIDGKVYAVGDMLGTATVAYVGIERKFTDVFLVPCDQPYVYRVFAYRFKRDDQLDDFQPEFARGRSYNEQNFAEIVFKKDTIPNIKIFIDLAIKTFCEGDTVIVRMDPPLAGHTLEWQRDGSVASLGPDSLVTIQTGKYTLRVTNKHGCYRVSNDLELEFLPMPNLLLSVNNKTILKDTSITVCNGDSVELAAYGAQTIQWYKNDLPITNETGIEMIARSSGKYFAIGANGSLCFDTSFAVYLNVIEINYSLDKSTIDFVVGKNETYSDQILKISNNSTQELVINQWDINLPPEFAIISPNFPLIIQPGNPLDLTIRFTPVVSGSTIGKLIFNLPCNQNKEVDLTGFKVESLLNTSLLSIIYGDLVLCQNKFSDTTITLTNKGKDIIEIPRISAVLPFEILGAIYPIVINPDVSANITLRFNPTTVGNYSNQIGIIFHPQGYPDQSDSVLVPVFGNSVEPLLDIQTKSINLTLGPCETYKDTTITLKNEGTTTIWITEQPDISTIEFLSLPIAIYPNQSINAGIRFEPQLDTDLNINLTASCKATPCDLQFSFDLFAVKEGWFYSIQKDTINLGDIIICDTSAVQDSIILDVSGNAQNKPIITGIIPNIIGADFATNYGIGTELGSQNVIKFFLTSYPDVPFEGSLTIFIQPCNVQRTVFIKGNPIKPKLSINPITIDFGEVPQNSSKTIPLVFTNTGSAPLEINQTDLAALVEPFSIDITSIDFPIIIAAPNSYSINIVFNPSEAGVFYDTLEINLVQPCPINQKITLSGVGLAEINGKTLISIPKIKAKPGDDIIIPVRVTAVAPFDFKGALLVALELRMEYNHRIFNLEGIEKGSVFANQNAFVTTISNASGIVTALIDQIEPDKIESGEFLVLKGKALWGNELKTEIRLDTAIFYSSAKIEYDKIEGEIEIDGECNPEQRFVDVGNGLNLAINSENPSDNLIKINFSVLTDEPTNLILYDYLGNPAEILLANRIKPGTYSVSIDAAEYSSGAYFLVLSNGSVKKVERVLIVK